MTRFTLIRIFVIGVLIVCCVLALSDSALAQCAMCRSSVPQAVAKNLNLAVVVLLAPPVSIFAAIFFIAFRKRKG